MIPIRRTAVLFWALSLGLFGQEADFASVRPILERRCLSCHGGEVVRSELQLVDAEHFRRGGARGPIVLADDLPASRLLAVIGYEDPNLAMPPSGQLPLAEREALKAWVFAGAPWPEGEQGRLAEPKALEEASHGPKKRPWYAKALAMPEVKEGDQGLRPIDALLSRAQAARGLEAAPIAAPEALLRRATFNFTGLPPTPRERAEFLAAVETEGAVAAYRALVERLLHSPHHAEHLARRWLDLVRYAETNGYERDSVKPMAWRYRDFVIRAFAEDLPYDRFLTWQLAGDEWALSNPEASDDLRNAAQLATGYLHLGVYDDEPADRDQAKADEIADIVDTTAQVFLATTYGCARCHDHKADPISQADYFGLYASFAGLKSFGARAEALLPDPLAKEGVPLEEQQRQVTALDRKLEALTREIAAPLDADVLPRRVLIPSAREGLHDWRVFEGTPPESWETAAFRDEAWELSKAGFGAPGTPGALIQRRWHSERIALRTTFFLEAIPKALHLDLHHDDHVRVFFNGQLVFERKGYTTRYQRFQLEAKALEALVIGRNVLAVSCEQDFGGQYIDLGLATGIDGEARGAYRARLDAAMDSLSPEDRARVLELLDQRRAWLQRPTNRPYAALVASEHGPEAPVTRIHQRGSVHAPGEEVLPRIPDLWQEVGGQALPPAEPLPQKSSGRRLALAAWMTGPGRFLTARVIANRMWQVHFGRGLCRSSGDFGALGEPPLHEDLLDYLAAFLIEQGWSLRALEREIATSLAAQRASMPTPAQLRKDPNNEVFARYEARRLTAEEFRDAVLASDGRLNRKLFGPSVYPPLPPEVLATASRPNAAWGRSSPEEAARRSLYIHVKRSLRMPLMEAFDQPSPDMACPDRFVTNVPTQSLMTLNGAFVHEAAKVLAQRVRTLAQDQKDQVRTLLEAAYCREITTDEVERHQAFVQRLQSEHGLSPEEALALLAVYAFNSSDFFWID